MRNVITAVLAAVLLTGCLAALADQAAANTFVVNNQATGASDKNPGTSAKPLKTIQAAANLARPGDTILVQTGIYREEVIPPRGALRRLRGESNLLSVLFRGARSSPLRT